MKIFISHSSKDKDYGLALVNLLKDIDVPQSDIIFTSKSEHGIPKGANIFDWLKNEIKEEPYVIYCLSDNYYNSVPCLNEMGAAWGIENQHMTLFLPDFKPSDKRFSEGAIDPREIGVFMDSQDNIAGFVQTLIESLNLKTEFKFINSAIKEYIEEVERVKKMNQNIVSIPDLDVAAKSKTSIQENVEQNITPFISKDILKNTGVYEKLLNEIKTSQLSDGELLLISYIVDCGKTSIGYDVQLDDQLFNIQEWESRNCLKNLLSSDFESLTSRFLIRGYLIKPIDGRYTEYKVDDSILKNMLHFPIEITDILNKTKKNKKLTKLVLRDSYF